MNFPVNEDGLMTVEDLLAHVRKEIEACGSMAEYCRRMKLSIQYVSSMLKGRFVPSNTILSRMGLERLHTPASNMFRPKV